MSIQSSMGSGDLSGVIGVTGSVGISGSIGVTGGPVGVTFGGITGSVKIMDDSGNVWGPRTQFGSSPVNYFPIINFEAATTGTTAAARTLQTGGWDGLNLRTFLTDISGVQIVGATFGPVGLTGFAAVTFGVASVTFPAQNAIGITGPVGVTFGSVGVTMGIVGVTGPITINSPVGLTGAVGITGPVAVTFGVVSATFGSVGVTFGAVGNTGAIGITGPVAVTFGVAVVTFPAQAAIGITGPVAVTFGIVSATFPAVGNTGAIGITGPVAVTFGVISATFPAVGNTGAIGITGPVAVTFGVAGVTFPVQNAIGITGPVGVTFGSIGATFGTATVVGPAADGAAVSGNPVRIAGKDASGNTQDVITDTTGRIWPFTGFVSTLNSRANSSLAGAGVFTGTFEDITQYSGLSISILDAGANGGTLTVNWSEDGTNVRDTDTVAVPTANGQQMAFGRKWQFYQVIYTHGAGAGNVLVQTILHTVAIIPDTHFGTDTITTSQDAQLVISQLRALNGTSFLNVLCDSSGNLIATSKIALTASAPTAATVGVASAQAVASNASRKGLVLKNTSSNTISFGIGATAVLNSGITLSSGEVWEMDEWTFATGAINAIASSASSNLAIQEYT